MNLTSISKRDFYSLLKEVYIDEINWKIANKNPSNLRIEDGQLVDDFSEDAYHFGFCIDGKPVFWFSAD